MTYIIHYFLLFRASKYINRGNVNEKNTKKCFILLSKVIMSMFYNKKYLRGRHFDNNAIGWLWCWKNLFIQKVIGINRDCPFPVSFRNVVANWRNIKFDVNDLNNFQHFGVYFQAWNAEIHIGKGSYIAPNVGLITQNHNKYNLDEHDEAKPIIIGDSSWIGMNSVILPGTKLGKHSIVATGSVVKGDFSEGYCIIAGNPAKIVKKLDKNKFV